MRPILQHMRTSGIGMAGFCLALAFPVSTFAAQPPALPRCTADFYWFTPATEVRDNCADVKGRAVTGAVKQP